MGKSRRADGKPDIPVAHFCHSDGCKVEIANDVFFCEHHQSMLSKATKRMLLAALPERTNWLTLHGHTYTPALNQAKQEIALEMGTK